MKVIVAWAFLPAASAFLPTSGPRGGTSRTGGVAFTGRGGGSLPSYTSSPSVKVPATT